jgi:hypothetical protein
LATYLYIADKDNFRIREVGIGTNCCGGYGTLGALVQKSGTFYILSNDHVLGRPTSLNVNSAQVGDPIVQPNSCNPFRTAANFASAPLLSSGVDAALATLVPGTMNSTGQINQLGIPANSTIPATVGMNVAKSGATSGLTCGQVQGVNITVKITLTPDCFVAPPFPTQFSNVIAISVGSKFSQPGDSGSLIVSSSTAQPTALLFAGNSTYTWGFGIDRVLSAVGGATIVGGGQHAVAGCPAAATTSMEPILSENAITNATMAKEHYVRSLMQDPQVIGVGVGRGATNANVPAVLVFVNRQGSHRAVPATLDGVTTRVIATDPIQIVTRCSALSR